MDVCQIFATFFPVTAGGVEQHIISLTKYLMVIDIDCFLITPRYGFLGWWKPCGHFSHLQRTDVSQHLKVYRVGILFSPFSKKRYIGPFLRSSLNKFDSMIGAYTWFRRTGSHFDLIHVHSGHFSLDLGLKMHRWSKRPLVVSLHQRFGYETGDVIPNYSRYKKMLKATSKIIVHRNSTRHVLETWGVGHKTVFIPMAIDVGSYKKPDSQLPHGSRIRILYVGRLDRRKDPLTLLYAFSSVNKEHPDTELHMIGDGVLKEKVESLARRLGLDDRIFFHGQQLDVRRFLWQSDIFVSTNIGDNYPSLALREAMAAGMPAVVTNVGETRELISNGVNGLLVKPSDSVSVSEALNSLIDDDKLKRRISRGALLTSKDFDMAKQIQNFAETYRRAQFD